MQSLKPQFILWPDGHQKWTIQFVPLEFSKYSELIKYPNNVRASFMYDPIKCGKYSISTAMNNRTRFDAWDIWKELHFIKFNTMNITQNIYETIEHIGV